MIEPFYMRAFLSSALCLAMLSGCNQSEEQVNNEQTSLDLSSISQQQIATDFAAHWLEPNIIALPKNSDSNLKLISWSKDNTQVKTASQLLQKIQWPSDLSAQYPHLTEFDVYRINVAIDDIKQLIKHRIAVVAFENSDSKSNINQIHHVQTSYLIDSIFTSAENDADEVADLGAIANTKGSQIKLWSPTAHQVSVKLFDEDKRFVSSTAMAEDTDTGIWQVKFDENLDGHFYQYEIENYHPKTQKVETFTTTDPYSLSLSTNSEHSQIVDLSSPSTQPSGWGKQANPELKNKEDAIFYELHIRDFSAGEKRLENEENRGKYGAFGETSSHGIEHLKTLKSAGLTHIHLLPAFDIGTVNEAPQVAFVMSDTVAKVCQSRPEVSICALELSPSLTIKQVLASFDPMGNEAQHLISELRQFDNYNWGYDPFHYTVPEGSYAKNPEGKARIIEFRQMIQDIHNMGFRVVMDVVYNHTHQAGLEPTAVLDKLVPNYYHRLNPMTGAIEQSTCCDNTATERVMMEKLMVDSLVVWAKDYKIDGFRFDLMGHQPKDAMLRARDAVHKVDPDNYFYGEGWNFGEVANNKQFIQASQIELAGTEIGTFSDRLRDAVRGAGFNVSGDDIRRNQGLGNGLGTIENELQNQAGAPDYQLLLNHTRLGLAGNLANYPLTLKSGEQALGKDILYGGQPTGYALDPADTVNYVSKHDNQTLWDNNQYRTAFHVSKSDRIRFHLQSLSYVLLGQGIPFIHMGSELLRSKSYLRDSYDYADWFNYVDFSKQANNYHVGLPPAEKDQENWPLIRRVIKQNDGKDMVTSQDIHLSSELFIELLKIRDSSDLFRLTTQDAVINQVRFLNTGPSQQDGLIVMQLTKAQDNNSPYQEIVVLFNANPDSITFKHSNAAKFILHPVQQDSVDNTVKQSVATGQGFTVPALTTAVFVK